MNTAEELVSRARGGDHEAFRLIFERYSRPVISFIFDLVSDRDLAEELTQETFVRAFRNLGTMREETKMSTWLFGIAKNVVREWIRAKGRNANRLPVDDPAVLDLSATDPTPADHLVNSELNRVIHRALSALDEDKRLVFTLKILHQRSYQEIAEITGFSIPKLKTDLHRARAEMRRRIRPFLGVANEL